MKRAPLLICLAAVCGLFFASTAFAATPLVYVGNISETVPQADVDAALPAFQTMVSRDLAHWWGTDATLTTDPALEQTADMAVYVEDWAVCSGCLGYHDVIGGRPVSRVFAATGASFDESWELTFTHELQEMLVDPWINHFAWWAKKMWLVEVSDPCEDSRYAYRIDGHVISDFITPGWYGMVRRQRVDFTRKLKRPGQIGVGGYASWLTPDGWKQVFG